MRILILLSTILLPGIASAVPLEHQSTLYCQAEGASDPHIRYALSVDNQITPPIGPIGIAVLKKLYPSAPFDSSVLSGSGQDQDIVKFSGSDIDTGENLNVELNKQTYLAKLIVSNNAVYDCQEASVANQAGADFLLNENSSDTISECLYWGTFNPDEGGRKEAQCQVNSWPAQCNRIFGGISCSCCPQ